nr:hypothetical protein GCM10020185_27320 [Pseudomonas brassicacearum subsp. brassicacearum]
MRCKRAGKHPFSSMDVEKYVGSQLRRQCGAAGISLKDPQIEVRIEIRDQRLFVIHSQHNSIGGYPLGSLEQTLVLMSGGFDSTVAAYQIMRRGLMSHFCFFNLGGRAHELGVMEVAHFIWKKYGSSQRVLFVSVPFEEVLGEILGKVDNSHMGVIFEAYDVARRFTNCRPPANRCAGDRRGDLPGVEPDAAEPVGDRLRDRETGLAAADCQPQAGHHRPGQ